MTDNVCHRVYGIDDIIIHNNHLHYSHTLHIHYSFICYYWVRFGHRHHELYPKSSCFVCFCYIGIIVHIYFRCSYLKIQIQLLLLPIYITGMY